MTGDLATIFALEETRQIGNDWVVRYHNRGLQVTPTRAARRVAAPGRRVLVRETQAGVVQIVVRDPASGREHVLAWTPVAVTTQSGRFVTPAAIPVAPVIQVAPVAAGYTRSGKPLSARQLELRARWDRPILARAIARHAPPSDGGGGGPQPQRDDGRVGS